jgi:hypothetical protein
MSGIVNDSIHPRVATDLTVQPSTELTNRQDQQRHIRSAAGQGRSLKGAFAVLSIVAVSVITYLPAINNSFISDDFTLLSMVKVLDRYPTYIIQATSELFRSVTYVYFWACFKLFGTQPEPYYWSSIVLHGVISLLIYIFVRTISRQPLAGLAAALFFAAYERHQEAIMWISAGNELILTLNCLLFLVLWERVMCQPRFRLIHLIGAASLFGLALFSKESATALAPLIVVRMVLLGYSPREVLRRSWLIILMAGMFGIFWLSQADGNFFVTQGHYAFSLQFFPVYFRTLMRLLSQMLPFLAVFLVIRARHEEHAANLGAVLKDSPILFFGTLLLVSIVPYSFLTYLDHIPSRNTYFPSVGLAAINGILFAATYVALRTVRARRLAVMFLSIVIVGNSTYVWVKKDPQYVERAAPTRGLIDILNTPDLRANTRLPLQVCGFPLHPWIGQEAVAGFTSFSKEEVLFSAGCDAATSGTTLTWDESKANYAVSGK